VQAVRREYNPNLPTAAQRSALENIAQQAVLRALPEDVERCNPPEGAVVLRAHNRPPMNKGSMFPKQAYPAHPFNFTPLKSVTPGFNALDRAVREVPQESRFDLLARRIEPRYASECPGTPRRELQDGMVAGIRVRSVQNPFVRLSAKIRYPFNTWPSRNWAKWRPDKCHVRGSRRQYRVPEDLRPYKDELGEWHPPRVSGRYKADIEKQYYMHSLPWVWKQDFFRGTRHIMDLEPRGQKYWYKKEYRRAQIAEALKKADSIVEEYRKERRDAKRLSWIENIVLEFAGDQLASPYVRTRRLPKM